MLSKERKKNRFRFFRAVSFFGLIFSLIVASAVPALAMALPSGPPLNLESELGQIQQFVQDQPDGDIQDKKAIKDELNSALGRQNFWERFFKRTDCRTVEKLTHVLNIIERLKERHPNAALEELYTRIWTLRSSILLELQAQGKVCEGFEDVGAEPSSRITQSDNQKLGFELRLGMPTLTTVKGNGQTFSRVHLPGLENMVGKPGEPAVPQWRTLVGVPEGATAKLVQSHTGHASSLKLNLVPFQEQAVDQAAPGGDPPVPPQTVFADKPFAYNQRSYETNAFFPAQPCSLQPAGQYRDLQVAQLECTTAQYNPVTREYRMFNNLNVEVVFEGGNGKFVTSKTLHPFESNKVGVQDAVLNKAAIYEYVRALDLGILPCQGEELLILTHANFREAADELAVHKRNKGIATSVFNVGSGVPSRDTNEEIDDFIEDRYDDCNVRPSYVMLMGDAEYIPTFYPADMPDNAGSDFPYSNYVQILFDAMIPDFGTGRIPVDTLAQAHTVVDKIVEYEASPPFLGLGNGAPFYTTAGLASQFQCCRMNANGTPLNNQAGTDQRAFIETTELVRNELLDRGYTAPRIYTRTTDDGGYCIQENASGDCIQTQAAYNGDATPRRYFNGTLLPGGIGAGSGFGWNGSTADITNAWNAGRFLFLHRDHGWPGGWAHPGFSSSNVDALSNGDLLPVVFSVNCASGIFDNETAGGVYDTTNGGVYFAERALRKADGGAIGILGDTRNSPTWANNALTRGFFDAVWPDTVPGHGGNTSHKRLGDILNWGKIYLFTQMNMAQTAGSISVGDMGYEYHIWHVIGDPTLEMWTKNPHKLVLSNKYRAAIQNNIETIHYAVDGATITKLEVSLDGVKAIGRAEVVDGVAHMEQLQRADPQLPVIYSASKPDSASVVLTPEGTGDPGPRTQQ